MTYHLFGSVGVLNGYAPDPDRKMLTVNFEPHLSGTLSADKNYYPVQGGKTICPADKIETAKDISFIDSKGKVYVLEPVNGDLRGLVRALAEWSDKQQEKIDRLEERIDVIERDFYPKDNGLF
ncbi:MAG: hypothetical protein J5958_06565 [Clostridia bacterium]|nr:hypothetical protein [Clostridia bacterium]